MVPSIILSPKQWFNPRMDLELNGLTGEPRNMESKAYWRMRFFQATPSHPRCFTWCLSLLPSCHEVISFALPWLSIITFLPSYHRSPLPSVPSDHNQILLKPQKKTRPSSSALFFLRFWSLR